MKKKFKKYFPSPEQVRASKAFDWLGNLLHDANLWHLNRHSVAGAFAVGLFICYVPIPLQMVQAAVLAILFRVNLPISVSLVFLTNPITIPPMFFLAYVVGSKLMGIPIQAFEFQFTLDWLFLELGARWRPFLLGCMVMGLICSFIGYVSIQLLWRLHLLQKIKERRLLRRFNK